MAATQIGNGWYDPKKGVYTYYDQQSGQLRSQPIDFSAYVKATSGGTLNDWNRAKEIFEFNLRSGSVSNVQAYLQNNANYGGGRNNVNVGIQVNQAARAIMQEYPNMTKDMAMQYANKWISDRLAMGWDSNEIENMMKDVGRGTNSINQDFISGVRGMIANDEFNDTNGNTTAASQANPAQSIQDELRAFGQSMMQVVGPDSPQAKRIAELAAQAGNQYAASSGLGPGGITTRGVASTVARAHTDLQTQRESIGLQALAAAGNQQLSVDAAKTALQAQNQQANVLNASGIGGLIGSGLGLVGGIVGSAYTNGAMAPAIPGLMQAGGAGGQALGGIIQNSGAPPITYGGQQQQTSNYAGKSGSTS